MNLPVHTEFCITLWRGPGVLSGYCGGYAIVQMNCHKSLRRLQLFLVELWTTRLRHRIHKRHDLPLIDEWSGNPLLQHASTKSSLRVV